MLSQRALHTREESLYFANWPRLFGVLILNARSSREEALDLAALARREARKGGY